MCFYRTEFYKNSVECVEYYYITTLILFCNIIYKYQLLNLVFNTGKLKLHQEEVNLEAKKDVISSNMDKKQDRIPTPDGNIFNQKQERCEILALSIDTRAKDMLILRAYLNT